MDAGVRRVFYLEPMFPECRQVRSTSDERNVVSRVGKAATVEASDTARTHDRNPHGATLSFVIRDS
jgi:hypothetical protein